MLMAVKKASLASVTYLASGNGGRDTGHDRGQGATDVRTVQQSANHHRQRWQAQARYVDVHVAGASTVDAVARFAH